MISRYEVAFKVLLFRTSKLEMIWMYPTKQATDPLSATFLLKTDGLIGMNLEENLGIVESTGDVSQNRVPVAISNRTKPITRIQIRRKPYDLPNRNLIWCTISPKDDAHLTEICQLLRENYIEDEHHQFRMEYSPDFLRWALTPPGWLKQGHVGIRSKRNGEQLVGFISGVPADIRVYDKCIQMIEVNYLCVHKDWRGKRLAPALFLELGRRCLLAGISQAVYTAKINLSTRVARCHYWHRPFNTKKLIETGFYPLPLFMTKADAIKRHQLPKKVTIVDLQEFDPHQHGEEAFQLLINYLKNFDLAPEFTREIFFHWFTPRQGVVKSYVVVDMLDRVTDFVSFYSISAMTLNHRSGEALWIACAFYAVARSVPLSDLIYEVLVIARNCGYDVFTALDVMDNKEFLQNEELMFQMGDGELNYYVYNWMCPSIKTDKIGLVLW